jgi:hypothetical protein
MSFSISGSTGKAGSTVYYLGTSAGSATADGSGNFTISGLGNGVYMVIPSSVGFAAVPLFQIVTIAGGNQTGINFTATSVYSSTDSRIPPNGSKDLQGTDQYLQQTSSNPGIPPVDCRTGGQPVDSRVSSIVPSNTRNTPH